MEGSTPAFAASLPLLRGQRAGPARCTRMCAEPESSDGPKAEAQDGAAQAKGEEEKVRRFKPIRSVKSNASWKNEFLDVFGRKGPGSRPDWDLRPASIRAQSAEPGAKIVCDFCKGTGLQTCSFCEGVDFMQDGKICVCPACKGEKKVQCSTCFGTTKQIELTENWWTKGVAKLFAEK